MTNKEARMCFNHTAVSYDSKVISDSLGLKFINREEINIIMNNLPMSHKCIVLDLGVGTGRIAIELVKKGVNVVGIDISKEMIQKAKQKLINNNSKSLNLIVASGENLPFTDNLFDNVISIRVLHYLSNWRGAISEVSRVTKTGGQVLMEVNGLFALSLIARLLGIMKAQIFNQFTFMNELNNFGLNTLQLIPFFRLPVLFYKKVRTPLMLKIIRLVESSLSFLPFCLLALRFFTISKKRTLGG